MAVHPVALDYQGVHRMELSLPLVHVLEPLPPPQREHPRARILRLQPPEQVVTRPGWVTWFGLTVVWLAAGVLSFASLRDLAVSCHVSARLAWLLPVVIDAGVAVSTRAWLSRRANPEAERFARGMTWTQLLLTVVLNGAHQGMVAHGVTPHWLVAVGVGAIPAGTVGAVVHLATLLGRAPVENVEIEQPTPVTTQVEPPAAKAPTEPDRKQPLSGAERARRHREKKKKEAEGNNRVASLPLDRTDRSDRANGRGGNAEPVVGRGHRARGGSVGPQRVEQPAALTSAASR